MKKEPSPNTTWHPGLVTAKERAALLRQKPLTVWLTGLSGSGKSTLAHGLERRLIDEGHACIALDGDNVRHGLCGNLAFSAEDRMENIRRIAEVAKLMNDAGLIVIAAFISPFRKDREMARDIVGPDRFFEVFIDTPLSICEARDPKGIYAKARSGALKGFTGIDAPYEPPEQPSLSLRTAETSAEQCIGMLMGIIQAGKHWQ